MNTEAGATVIGPFSQASWNTMKNLQDQIKLMSERPDVFKPMTIRKRKYLFSKIVDKSIDMDEM